MMWQRRRNADLGFVRLSVCVDSSPGKEYNSSKGPGLYHERVMGNGEMRTFSPPKGAANCRIPSAGHRQFPFFALWNRLAIYTPEWF